MGRNGDSGAGRVTQVLQDLRRDTPGAQDELLQLVYDELKRLARAQMRRQPPDHTLQPTALVHEAYLRLMGGGTVDWNDRSHFLGVAAKAMRSILVDFTRSRLAKKRGGDRDRVRYTESTPGESEPSHQILAVHEALERFEAIDPRGSRVVELHFFAGLTLRETARVMGLAESSLYRIWEHARSWLYREISS